MRNNTKENNNSMPSFTWGGTTVKWESEAKEVVQLIDEEENHQATEDIKKKTYYIRDQK